MAIGRVRRVVVVRRIVVVERLCEVRYKVEDGPFEYWGACILLPMNTTRR